MKINKALDDGEPEPQAVVLAPLKPFGLLESLKDVREEIRRDADAGVFDNEFRRIACGFERNGNSAAVFRELDAVVDEVQQNLLQPGLDAINKHGLGWKAQRDLNALVRGLFAHRIDGRFGRLTHV